MGDKQYLIYESTLTGIADAIRGKTGGTEPILVSDLATEIEGISGKPAVTEPLNVTENGTYTPDAGVDGFSPVTVNVQASGGDDWYITDASNLFLNGARLNAKEELIAKCKGVTNTANMFKSCSSLSDVDLTGLDTSEVTDMQYMFNYCTQLRTLDLSSWNTGKVKNMTYMFGNCTYLNTLNASGWDTSKVTDMSSMFRGCNNLNNLTANFDTSSVTTMKYMFNNCGITALDASGWDTSKVTDMSSIFTGASYITDIIGFSATNKAGLTIGFNVGSSESSRSRLKRLTFRTDLADGVYSIRSAINIKHCSFERDGMVEMFNTLPDVSGLGLSSAHTTITITGNPCVTDGTLTAEDEAIATAKGWTLVK